MAAYGGAAPFRSREGLSTRAVAGSDEIQLRIDPMQGDLDDEISGLHNQVRRLRYVAEEIGTEAKFQNDFLNQLACSHRIYVSSTLHANRKTRNMIMDWFQDEQMTMIKAQAGVKNNVRRLNKSIIQNGSNSVVHVVLFALVCFFVVYMWSKMSRK